MQTGQKKTNKSDDNVGSQIFIKKPAILSEMSDSTLVYYFM